MPRLHDDLPPGRVVGPWWNEAFIVAGGPSAGAFDLEALRGQNVLCINRAAIELPWCSALTSADHGWIGRNADFLARYSGQSYLVIQPHNPVYAAAVPGVTYLEGQSRKGLSRSPGVVHFGGHSGFSALNVAFLKMLPAEGRKRLVLLGYDLKRPAGKDHHWYGDGGKDHSPAMRYWHRFANLMALAAAQFEAEGIEVVNANPDSLIRCFRMDSNAAPRRRE